MGVNAIVWTVVLSLTWRGTENAAPSYDEQVDPNAGVATSLGIYWQKYCNKNHKPK